MIISSIMTKNLIWLTTESLTKEAENMALENEIYHLPVLRNEKYVGILDIGIISEEDLESNTSINYYVDSFENVSISPNQFAFDVLHLFKEFDLTALPVTTDDNELLGILKATDILEYLSKTFSISNPGSFITLKLESNGYNLQEISRIVESNNAQIISLHFEPKHNDLEWLLTIKINRRDLSHIIATFERFNYEIVADSSIDENDDEIQARYDQLMKYLNI